MAVRAIRGATQLSADDRDEMIEAVVELVEQMLSANGLTTDALISMILTSTPDLTSEFPAFAARQLGMGDVPLLCASEIDVAGELADEAGGIEAGAPADLVLEALHQFAGKAAGEQGQRLCQVDAGHFPVAGGGVLARGGQSAPPVARQWRSRGR
mgnify:CR=1 FL=1